MYTGAIVAIWAVPFMVSRFKLAINLYWTKARNTHLYRYCLMLGTTAKPVFALGRIPLARSNLFVCPKSLFWSYNIYIYAAHLWQYFYSCQTLGHLMLSLSATAYMWLAVMYLEEPNLIKTFGKEYRQYMKRTPRFLPNIWNSWRLQSWYE